MSAGLRGHACRRARILLLLGVPGILNAGAKDHDRIRTFFDPNCRAPSSNGLSTVIRERRESVLPPLPQINIPARRGEVPLLEVPAGIRPRVVAAKPMPAGQLTLWPFRDTATTRAWRSLAEHMIPSRPTSRTYRPLVLRAREVEQASESFEYREDM